MAASEAAASKEGDHHAVFDALDLDGDGTLDLQDFLKAYEDRNIDSGASMAQIEGAFNAADLDGSGALDLDEFHTLAKNNHAWWKNHNNGGAPGSGNAGGNHAGNNGSSGAGAGHAGGDHAGNSHNNNGDHASKNNHVGNGGNHGNSHSGQKQSNGEHAPLFHGLDANGSGGLDLSEFASAYKEKIDPDANGQKIGEAFNGADVDGNGAIDLDEFHALARSEHGWWKGHNGGNHGAGSGSASAGSGSAGGNNNNHASKNNHNNSGNGGSKVVQGHSAGGNHAGNGHNGNSKGHDGVGNHAGSGSGDHAWKNGHKNNGKNSNNAKTQTVAAPAQTLGYEAVAQQDVKLIGSFLFIGGFLLGGIAGFLGGLWRAKKSRGKATKENSKGVGGEEVIRSSESFTIT